jgi:hypothetical protein
LITIYIAYVNYISILYLNIEQLDIWYLTLLALSIGIGIDLSSYLQISYIDFNKINKNFSNFIKILGGIGIFAYIPWIVLLKYGIVFDVLNKFTNLNETLTNIQCEGTTDKKYLKNLQDKGKGR